MNSVRLMSRIGLENCSSRAYTRSAFATCGSTLGYNGCRRFGDDDEIHPNFTRRDLSELLKTSDLFSFLHAVSALGRPIINCDNLRRPRQLSFTNKLDATITLRSERANVEYRLRNSLWKSFCPHRTIKGKRSLKWENTPKRFPFL